MWLPFPRLFFCYYSSYCFFDFSLDFDCFDSFVVLLDHLLRVRIHHASYLVGLVFATSIYCNWCCSGSCSWCRFGRSRFDRFDNRYFCLNWLFPPILAFLCFSGCLSLLEALLARTRVLRILLCFQSRCSRFKINFRP